ncbi:hypothetical protein COEREDRAFT_43558 [Coemansia reversa NRRL 1564]|uniref:Mg2+ transporter protein n=1 Tax=Coemansia reversa (strain ATCC 12441 / NRRL 1564) TaxID=763665 RepID=A0A2G5BBI2_COERN|nr:hypothetical protein COEREDRAFT_43558 [Coemansia reversa NRRL 1564]|eukprot:PIA16067.1 hypothetical protein COEREDRAFT_43558 [Coemansia reversa NRRL 1564]
MQQASTTRGVGRGFPDGAGQTPLFWLDVVDPTDSEITALAQIFGLHSLTTEELLQISEQTLAQDSFKTFRHYDIICYRTSSAATTSTAASLPGYGRAGSTESPVAFYAIVLDEGVITLHNGNVAHVRNTIGRLRMDEEVVRLTPFYIAYLLLEDITDTLVPTTRLLEMEVDTIDEIVLILTRAEHDDVLKRIGTERRHALWLVRLLHGKAEVLRALERHGRQETRDGAGPDVGRSLADVHDRLVSLTASVHHCERILARAHGNYLARINLELTHASNTTNQLATQMTVLAGLFLPLNLIAGIFGMNVKVPGRDRDDLRDFALIVGSMGLFVVLTLAFCRWRRII